MMTTLTAGERTGTVTPPASKSQAHRLLICAALGQSPTELLCDGISEDISATAACLNALGAEIRRKDRTHFSVTPIKMVPKETVLLPCGESGSTLRFLLPIVGALGVNGIFLRKGRLPQRPLFPLDEQLCMHGMEIQEEGDNLHCSGQLQAGEFLLPGNVSSQYISGLLLAMPLLSEDSTLTVTRPIESAGYIAMTENALRLAGVTLKRSAQTWFVAGRQQFRLPTFCRTEGDWSGAAFFLCAGALSSEGVTVKGLSLVSSQGDREVIRILTRFGAIVTERRNSITVRRGNLHGIVIDAASIPDLIPTLCVVAAAAEGTTVIQNAARLRLKESDRLHTTAMLLSSLGGKVKEQESSLIIHGVPLLRGGSADSCNDHRIAMAAAVAACVSAAPVTVCDSECVKKSYPRFWEDFSELKGAAV